jgi:xanthine dehydrogenase YagS FAD-binding subunit
MAYIKEEGGMLKIGALTTLTAIANSSLVKDKYTVLAQAAKATASPELRNMGTIGGNICQKPRCIYFRNEFNNFPCLRKSSQGMCYAIAGVNKYHSIFGAANGCVAVCPSDTAPALVALGANIVTSKKTWKAADFFGAKGEQINNLDADEIVTEIQVPTPAAGTKSAYKKFAFRKSIDFPLVSAAVVISSSNASIVLGGVYNTPRVATAAQDAIKGKAIDETSADAAGTAATTGATALSQNKYKIQITKTMVKRAILACK